MMRRAVRTLTLASLLGLAAASGARAQRVEPSCAELRGVVDSIRSRGAANAEADRPSLGFRDRCRLSGAGAGAERRISCHQYAGFTHDLYDGLVTRIAACFPDVTPTRTTARGTGTYPSLVTRFDLGDALIAVTLTGLMTRRGNDLYLSIAPPER